MPRAAKAWAMRNVSGVVASDQMGFMTFCAIPTWRGYFAARSCKSGIIAEITDCRVVGIGAVLLKT
jgi:hypothetical protein